METTIPEKGKHESSSKLISSCIIHPNWNYEQEQEFPACICITRHPQAPSAYQNAVYVSMYATKVESRQVATILDNAQLLLGSYLIASSWYRRSGISVHPFMLTFLFALPSPSPSLHATSRTLSIYNAIIQFFRRRLLGLRRPLGGLISSISDFGVLTSLEFAVSMMRPGSLAPSMPMSKWLSPTPTSPKVS
jgi:hypothetical protein